jgi:hypothetical protein
MPSLGMPPLPPSMSSVGAAAPQPQQPSMMSLAGMGGPNMGAPGQTAGMSQISSSAVRMGSEIDQALKLLAQAIPSLAPWVEKTTYELRFQLGQALNSGAVPTDPSSQDSVGMPDGMGRL